jgi:hypothetical protein
MQYGFLKSPRSRAQFLITFAAFLAIFRLPIILANDGDKLVFVRLCVPPATIGAEPG